MSPADVAEVLAQPSQAGLSPYIGTSIEQLLEELGQVRARGWPHAEVNPAGRLTS